MLSKSVNQDSEIWFINCKVNCYISTILFNRSYNLIDRFSIICSSTIARVINIYLLDNFFNDCTIILFITTRERFWNTRVCKSNRRVLFNFVRNNSSIRSLASKSIYLSICFASHLHYRSRYLTKIYAFARQIDTFFSFLFKRHFNSLVMNSIFLFFCDNRVSNSFSLKTLFTYDERLATLKFCLRFFETSRHFKTIMIVVDFSKNDHSNFNVMQCIICSLLIYDEYFTLESLKKHFQNASHCSLALQFQQEVESKKIVEKSKIEFLFVLVSLVKSLSTYEKRLTILTNWIWFDTLSRKTMTIVEFRSIHDEYRAKCMHCSLTVASNRKFESLKKHFQKSFECSFVLQLEISKSISVAVDIEYFDSTFLCDIQEFDLHHESANFSQHLQNIRINYREEKLLSLLLECFRDFALFWYKQQNEIEIVKDLNEWLEVLITAFSTKFSKFEIFSSVSSASRLSFQYHSCLNCFAFFSSLTRLLQHTQKIVYKKIVCKHCEKIFDSKNKFHEHIRQHHATKKMNKFVSKRNFNRKRNKSSTISSTISKSISSTTITKFSISRSVTFSKRSRNSSISLVIFATIALATSKRSHFSLFTFKFTSKFAKTASINLFISFATFSSRFRKSISKFHFTIHDFHRMFVEKSKSFDLFQHQKHRFFSQSFESRQFDRSNTFYQFRIIIYFLSVINQKTSINQNLKNSNSKNFQQYTFAKSLSLYRFVLLIYLSEKSIFSLYKKSSFFYISLQSKFSTRFSFQQSRFSFAWFRFIFSFTFSFTSSSYFRFSFSNHVCCICFDHFNFRNDSFDYSWFNHRYSSNRRSLREIWKR